MGWRLQFSMAGAVSSDAGLSKLGLKAKAK